MTSRNYLFNSIKENIRRNFYLLILLSVSMLAVLPAYTIMQMELAPLQYPAMGSSLNSSQEMLLKCLDSTNPGVQIVVIGAAVLLAMTGFSYLHAGKKTDFYHSLPLKREELFMISFSSGFFTFLLPYLVSVALTCLVGAVYGGFSEQTAATLFQAMGIHILFFVVIYSAAILAVLLTGNLFTALLAFLGMMSYGWLVYMAYQMLNDRFLYTMGNFGNSSMEYFLSPVISYIGVADTLLIAPQLQKQLIILHVVLAVVLLAADICIYKIRPSESYHKAIAFQKLQPLIKVCCIIPIALVTALLFSSGMTHSFVWLVIAVLIVSLVLSVAFEFLYTMDLRKSLRPRVSSGMVLAAVLLVLTGYKMDITGYDSYLPKKEKIETMSVYFPSINGRFSYSEDYFTNYRNAEGDFLKKTRIKDFAPIYELAKMGVEASREEKKTDYGTAPELRESVYATPMDYVTNQNSQGETLVSVYVAYHLKSGRTVYRAYMIPETEEVISQITAVYDDWSYREKMLPTSYQKAEDIDYLYLDTFYESRKQISGGRSELEEIYKTYKTELENMSFQESCENRVVGYLITEKEWKDYGNDTYTTSYSLPIYENFTKTMGLLKEAGEEVLVTIDSEQVEALTLSFWNEEQEKTVEIKDNAQIETLSEHLTYEDCRYGVDSRVEYDIMVNILWKNREYSSPNVYLMGDESVEDILKNLNFD